MFKKILLFLSLITIVLPAYAQVSYDFSVTCDLNACKEGESNYCTLDYGSPIFNESGILPGNTISKNFIVNNTGKCKCNNINFKLKNATYDRIASQPLWEVFLDPIPSDVLSKFFTEIRSGSTVYTSSSETIDSLNNVVLALGSLDSGASKVYDWNVTFDPAVGNNYQGVKASFDFDLEVRCGTGPDDDSNDDGDDEDENGGGDGESSDTEGGVDEIRTFIGGIGNLGSIAGTTSVVGTGVTESAEVEGIEDVFKDVGECVNPKFWWLLFILQALLQVILIPIIFEKNRAKIAFRFILGVIFGYLFYKHFCPQWDVLVSIIITVLSLLF